MNEQQISRVTEQVIKTYPEMRGSKPTIREQPQKGQESPCFLLTYRGKVSLPTGRSMNRIVHVVVNERGKVLRMSTSK